MNLDTLSKPSSAAEVVNRIIERGGWLLAVPPDRVRLELPPGHRDLNLVDAVRQNKAAVLEILKQRGGWVGDSAKMAKAATDWRWRSPSGKLVSALPHCTACCSYYLFRETGGTYTCQSCELSGIEESTARRVM
jgi:hypothetical protein